MNIELTQDEVSLLTEVVEGTVRDLSYEIADTDNHAFRAGLKERRDALRGILDRLVPSTAS